MNKHMIRGCWQLAAGHSAQPVSIAPILSAIEAGFTVFDCADIYLGVESLLGRALKHVPEKNIRIHTKFVPDLNRLDLMTPQYVESIIDRSLKRLQIDCIDLVQFHWWDFNIEKYFDAMDMLSALKAKGKIAAIGLTNVNKTYLEAFAQRFDIASLQVQVSLFDRRAERGIDELCRQKNIKLLGYGGLLGGFLSEKWLGQPSPQPSHLANRSLVKYQLLIESACGWEVFQARLTILKQLADQYACSISSIALAALIQAKRADAVIVGLSPQNFLAQNQSLRHLPMLNVADLAEVTSWHCALSGDAYDEERDINSAHANIMKYNLNAEAHD